MTRPRCDSVATGEERKEARKIPKPRGRALGDREGKRHARLAAGEEDGGLAGGDVADADDVARALQVLDVVQDADVGVTQFRHEHAASLLRSGDTHGARERVGDERQTTSFVNLTFPFSSPTSSSFFLLFFAWKGLDRRDAVRAPL